jgi:hypothetical protein
MLTRDHHCEDIGTLIENYRLMPEQYWQYYYFNITNPKTSDSGNQDRLIKLLRETDIGEVSIPELDRDLFFGQHAEKNYLEFPNRETDLLHEFNNNKVWGPVHEQNEQSIGRVKFIQKSFIRHQYFEGKSEMIPSEIKLNSEIDQNSFSPSYLKRLPYHSVYTFVDVLKWGDKTGSTKSSISRAISLNEGCDNPGIDKEYLVLSSSEVTDPISKSYRLFDLSSFELFVNRTDHLVKYLEYEPDSLTFRHKDEKHIKLTISLDLYEMLYFIQRGFTPSLNDLRGRFIELIIFKNLLENLYYSEVVVTKDNYEFFRISKNSNNHLLIEPMITE